MTWEEFVEKVKAEFPNWEELHKALDDHNLIVGRFLDDSKNVALTAKEVVKAFEEGREKEVLLAAQKEVRLTQLYGVWWSFVKSQ